MKRILLSFSLAAALCLTPAFAGKRSPKNSMRGEFDAAIKNGNLNEQERQKYDAAMKTLDDARSKRKSGETADRAALKQAMTDLRDISKSENLKPEDRDKLAKAMKPARGRRVKQQ